MAQSFRISFDDASPDRNQHDLENASRISNAARGFPEKQSEAAQLPAPPVVRPTSPRAFRAAPDFDSPQQLTGRCNRDANESPSRSYSYADKPARIAIKSKGKILLINPTDVLAVEAEGNYVSLLLASGSHILRESISSMAEKLKCYGFVRIHRSVIVNASYVEELSPGATGEYILHITGGKQYVVSRTYRRNLKHLAHSWIGLDSFVAD